MASEIYTRTEAAQYLRISIANLANLTAQGRIPSILLGRRRLYTKARLDAFLESCAA